MSDMLFLSGQIRSLEKNLLTRAQIDRMITAPTPEDAFGVLIELQYAKYFDTSLQAKNFELVLSQGLLETKEFLDNEINNEPLRHLLWLRFDIGNIKRALKAFVVENDTALECLDNTDGFVWLGEYSVGDVRGFIMDNSTHEQLFPEIATVIQRALNQDFDSFFEIDTALDEAALLIFSNISKSSSDPFVQKIYNTISLHYTLRSVAHSVLLYNQELNITEIITKHSTLSIDTDTASFVGVDGLKYLLDIAEVSLDMSAWNSGDVYVKLLLIENVLEKKYMDLLHDCDSGAIGGLVVPLWYMETRLRNAQTIKTILLAKFQGMTPDNIYALLPHL